MGLLAASRSEHFLPSTPTRKNNGVHFVLCLPFSRLLRTLGDVPSMGNYVRRLPEFRCRPTSRLLAPIVNSPLREVKRHAGPAGNRQSFSAPLLGRRQGPIRPTARSLQTDRQDRPIRGEHGDSG